MKLIMIDYKALINVYTNLVLLKTYMLAYSREVLSSPENTMLKPL
ncbi:27387_t:CDS:2 [Racocetra persica]|uniref:27387_t:CDS:1 n=1 Tax=Racocetra persica TaxID=160502 RepID=A0ACA9KEK0_9GLOM|nr:27387_t:CDS:2 [Racocetra persica]